MRQTAAFFPRSLEVSLYLMPYEWKNDSTLGNRSITLHLWPYRSLLKKHFVLFVGATAACLSLPLMMTVGTSILWGLLPFLLLTVGGIWVALQHSYRTGSVIEELTITPSTTRLTQCRWNAEDKEWSANPYWVSVHLHPTSGPVENYITLRGGDREVEIGRFLDSAERAILYTELSDAFRKLPADATP